MSLQHLYIPTDTVQWGEQQFDVRGLTVTDVSMLVAGYRDKIDELVDEYVAAAKKENEDAVAAVDSTLKGLLGKSPRFAAQIIACAANDPERIDTVMQLPFAVQLDGLLKVFRLSFEEAGGIKKFLDDLINLMGLTNGATAALREPLTGMLN